MNNTVHSKANAAETLYELGRALNRLEDVLARAPESDDIVLDATIQRFEFSIELLWKTLKKFLAVEGFEVKTPKEALQKAYATQWIDHEALWLDMLNARNLTSHTYKADLAHIIYQKIHTFYPEMQRLYSFLNQRYSGTSNS